MATSKEGDALDLTLLTPEEQDNLIRDKSSDQDALIDQLVTQAEALPAEKQLNFCRRNMPSAFRAVSEIKKAMVCKQLGKLLGVSASAIKKELQPVYSKSVNWFDDDGHFIPPPLIDRLLIENRIEYDRQDLFIYQDGVFVAGGRDFIKKQVLEMLGDDYRDMHGGEVIRQMETRLKQEPPVLDTDPFIINLENGIIDIREPAINLKKHHPNYMSSIRIPIKYDPAARCPQIQKFFTDVLQPDCIEIAEELFGYCLLPNARMQKAFLLKSGGESGKSVFIELLSSFLGEKNVSGDSLDDLVENRFRVADLSGKLANICADISNKVIEDTSLFKALVGGDWVMAERKGKDPFKFKNIAKLIFSANELPRTKDNSHGFFRRWVILDFPNQFLIGDPRRDPNLIDKLVTPEELSGLLNLALDGMRRLLNRGSFAVPETAAAALLEYNLQNDSAKAFLMECVSESFDGRVARKTLYDEYKKYCADSEIHPVSNKKFTPKVREVFPKTGETNYGERVWVGIRIGEGEIPF